MVINEFNRRASSVDQERLQERSRWAKQRESVNLDEFVILFTCYTLYCYLVCVLVQVHEA